jgi:hypothetical protein
MVPTQHWKQRLQNLVLTGAAPTNTMFLVYCCRFFAPGGSDSPCISCAANQVSATGSTSSDDCFDDFTSIAPYDYLETPVSAWTVLLVDGAANSTTNAVDCRAACKTEPRCQYWLFRAGEGWVCSHVNMCLQWCLPQT